MSSLLPPHAAALLAPAAPAATAVTVAEADGSVAAGREALAQWGRYPWYDKARDGLQPVELAEPWDWSWLLDWLNLRIGPLGGSGDWLHTAAWVLIALLFALLAWFLLRAYRRRSPALPALVEAEGDSPEEAQRRYEALPEGAGRRRSGLREESRRQYLAGNYDEAIVYLFSHQLVFLDRHELIHLARGKTNRQYLRELGPRGLLLHLLGRTTSAFEDVFFGGRSIGRERFERCWNQLDQFEAMAGKEGG
ncbi:MAG: DUF4129 domain-containing protein [Planctomycetota bacterium]|nr:DUF4129 domain-containing protein [Planctomycetota bacterium]